MKTNLKKMLSLVTLGISVLATTVPSGAGTVSTREVVVVNNQYYHYASGSMTDARYSADNQQYIECEFDSGWLVTCRARDKTGRTVICSSNDRTHAAELQGMTDSSYIHFSVNQLGGCNLLVITNSSDMLQ
jgi:hypothetical protein